MNVECKKDLNASLCALERVVRPDGYPLVNGMPLRSHQS